MAQLMQTSNPALRGDAFRTGESTFGESMTVSGTVNKTGILLLCCVATAAWTWNRFSSAPPEEADASDDAGTRHRRHWRLHCRHRDYLQERVGGDHRAHLRVAGRSGAGRNLRHSGKELSRHRNPSRLPDFRHTAGHVARLPFRPHQGDGKLRLGIVAATGGIAVFYLLQFVLGFFGVHFTAINGSGPIGIGFSLIVVAVAALNLVLDFDMIENGARLGAPKYMEWYGAFALMVTLIWLYFEILRLLSKFRSR